MLSSSRLAKYRAGDLTYAFMAALLGVFAIAFGIKIIVHTTIELPANYRSLESNGAHATAYLDKCAVALGGGRGVACQLSLHWNHADYTWVYPEDTDQFSATPVGSAVVLLVDPSNPHIAYTLKDVEARDDVNQPVLILLGVVAIAGGGVFLSLGLKLLGLLKRSKNKA